MAHQLLRGDVQSSLESAKFVVDNKFICSHWYMRKSGISYIIIWANLLGSWDCLREIHNSDCMYVQDDQRRLDVQVQQYQLLMIPVKLRILIK